MNAWFQHHLHSAGHAVGRLLKAPVSTALNVSVIGIALSLPILGYNILEQLNAVSPRLQGEPEVTVFIAPGAGRADLQAVERALRADAAVRNVRFIARDAALEDLRRSAGVAGIVAAIKENPLPDAYVATLAGGEPEAAERLVSRARALAHVQHAQADVAWSQRLESIISAGQKLVGLLAAVLGIGLLAVVFNTIRLQLLTAREEIEVSRLVGATDAYVRRPFLYWGALLGALGGLIGVTIAVAAHVAVADDLSRLFPRNGAVMGLSLLEASLACLSGTVLGWLGAVLSVSRHLHDIARE